MQANPQISQLIPLNLSAPGAAGLTGETSMAGDVEEWLFEAHNAVYNQEGLLSPRRLWKKLELSTTFNPTPFTAGSIVYPAYAASIYFICDNGKFWLTNGTDITTLGNDGNAPTAWTGAVRWKAVHLNKKWYLFSEGREAKVYDPYAGPPATYSGVPDAPEVGIVHAAFGRLWAASQLQADRKLYWSLLLNGKDWTSAGTGSLDLTMYLSANESITAISDFNGFLIVFTNQSILIFQDPFTVPIDSSGTEGTVQSMTLKEQINGTGCVGKNAWCHAGEELLFMSHQGIKSLGRVLQDGGSNPLETVSPQAQRLIMNAYKASSGSANNQEFIVMNYHAALGFVTIETGTVVNPVYLLWINRPIGRGVYPVTRWGKLYSELLAGDYLGYGSYQGLYPTGGFAGSGPGITALIQLYKADGTTIHYHGLATYGMMSPLDDAEVVEEGFRFLVKSAWLSFGDQASPLDKIPKDLKFIYRTPQSPETTVSTPDGTALSVTFSLGFDYGSETRSHTFTTPLTVQGSFDVSTSLSPHAITPIPLAGQGSLVQWSVTAFIDNRSHESFAIQRAGFQVKVGRIHQGI